MMRRFRWAALAAGTLAISAGCPQEIPPPKEEPIPTVNTGQIEPESSPQINPDSPGPEIPSETAGREPADR